MMARKPAFGSKGSAKAVEYDLSDDAFNTFMTTIELAARWKVKPATLIKARSEQTSALPHYKLHGAVRYLLADIERYERSRRLFPDAGRAR